MKAEKKEKNIILKNDNFLTAPEFNEADKSMINLDLA